MRAQWRCSSSRCSSGRRGPSSSCSTAGWSMRKRQPQGRRHGWIAYEVALPLQVVMIAPFLYMVATALTSEPDSLRHLVPEHFAAALAALPFERFLLTSVIFSLAVV